VNVRDLMDLGDGERHILSFDRRTVEGDSAMDVIFINGLRGETVIGIHHSELYDPQPLRVDLAIGVPRSASCRTDRIEDTIDYGEVRSAIHEMFREHSCSLLEAFAEQIALMVIKDFGAHQVRVTVTKPHKFDDVEGVGVTIKRVRACDANPSVRCAVDVFQQLGHGLIPDQD